MSTPKYTFICVLDFEGVCNAQYQNFNIIEFPGVLLRVVSHVSNNNHKYTTEIVSTFQRYVKPVQYDSLPKECTDITGITNEMIIKQGVTFDQAYDEYFDWLTSHLTSCSNKETKVLPTSDNILYVTCGDWDLGKMLPLQCQLQFPPIKPNKNVLHDCFKQWCNMKDVFSAFYKTPVTGMAQCLKKLNMLLVGKHHSGIDDCKNIAAIVQRMIEDGCTFAVTGKLNADLKHEKKHAPKNKKQQQQQVKSNEAVEQFDCGYDPRMLSMDKTFVIAPRSREQQDNVAAPAPTKPVVNQQKQTNKPAAVAVCKFFNTPQGCKFGANCKFKHQNAV